MPSRKQRRHREKDRRHEYEYVYVDEEGREVDVDPDEANEPASKDKRPAPTTRAGRKIEPASWQRVGRRALIFAPLMFLTIRLLEKNKPVADSLTRTVLLLLIFLPFSYVMDSLLYRSYVRRTGAGKKS